MREKHIVLKDLVKEYENGEVIAVDSLDLQVTKGDSVRVGWMMDNTKILLE